MGSKAALLYYTTLALRAGGSSKKRHGRPEDIAVMFNMLGLLCQEASTLAHSFSGAAVEAILEAGATLDRHYAAARHFYAGLHYLQAGDFPAAAALLQEADTKLKDLVQELATL